MSVGIWDMGFYMGICTKKWKDAWKLLFNHFLYPKTMSIEEYSLSEGGSIWATKRSLTWQSIESWLCNDGILEMVLLWGISLDTYILRAAPKDKEIKRKIKQNKVTWLMENKGNEVNSRNVHGNEGQWSVNKANWMANMYSNGKSNKLSK